MKYIAFTVTEINAMSEQDIFDHAVRRLAAQGKQSIGVKNGRATCLYRAPNGSMCIAGPFVPKEQYRKFMEGSSFDQLDVDGIKIEVGILSLLQQVHDNMNNWTGSKRRVNREIKKGLRKVTLRCELSDKVLRGLDFAHAMP